MAPMPTELRLPQEVLDRKRSGHRWSPSEITQAVAGISDGSWSDAQVGAFAMAVCLAGMDAGEIRALTLAMRDSGECIDWSDMDLPGPRVDKHSTGGVGDLTSLVLAPLLAACGACVPMLSGRGLGHTGGTLDKLESLPGVCTYVDVPRLRSIVHDCGLAIVAAGDGLAPADRRLYAVRDVTGTVGSIPLITASILSKKLASGSKALVLDVKVGNGATVSTLAQSKELASSLVEIANASGLPTSALLSDMSQPLVDSLGNALEMQLAIDYLTGRATPPRLHELTLALGEMLLVQSDLSRDAPAARTLLEQARASGAAAERLAQMVRALGGPADCLQSPGLETAPVVLPVWAPKTGWIAGIDTHAIGMAIVGLGGGRRHPSDHIDVRVGLSDVVSLGDHIEADRPLALIHAATQTQAEEAAQRIRKAFQLGEETPPPPLLIERILPNGATP